MTKRHRSIGDSAEELASKMGESMAGSFYEDLRRAAPEFTRQLDDACATLPPIRGQVRAPCGLVHSIVGDYTYCDIQWVAYSRKEQRPLRVMGWCPTDAPVSCLTCLVDP